MYKFLIRPFLFLFNPEGIHHFTFRCLKIAGYIPGFKKLFSSVYVFDHPLLKRTFFGLAFRNPVGLAAGFDKNAKLIDEFSCFGFGFIEIGTLTPKAQPGNPLPRLFRLPEDQGLINRMGFNNQGADIAVQRLKKRKSDIIVGGNIGKNKITPNENAVGDYRSCFETLYPYVDYFVVNVSSPNTPGLRALQEKGPLKELLTEMRNLSQAKEKPKPVLLKIAPDLTAGQLDDVVEILLETKTDGVIATNTTISREGLQTSRMEIEKIGAGGLSGKPLTSRSNEVVKYLREKLGKNYVIVGVGGIMSPQDAIDMIDSGADLIQIYTGFVYEGPSFIKKINKALVSRS